ncbi:MAG: hypothetical protein IJI45_08440 [Anaerolineaceae bacterium]|nr:hypothetical protein [Anaerolineaceae bacterium]
MKLKAYLRCWMMIGETHHCLIGSYNEFKMLIDAADHSLHHQINRESRQTGASIIKEKSKVA